MQFFEKKGLIHWLVQRISAGFLLVSITFFFNNVFLFGLLLVFLSFHVFAGIETLLDDYVHDQNLFIFSFTFLRIFVLFLLKVILIVIL